MQLTEEQKQTVAQWVNSGASLKEVQSKLEEEYDLSMTYMDVRFLVDDLDLDLTEPGGTPENYPQTHENASGEGVHFHEEEPKAAEAESMSAAEDEVIDAEAEFVGGGGKVSVEVDKLTRPGAVVSGSATFSDGTQAGWQLDQMGRLGLIPPEGKEDFRPSEEDLQDFQRALQAELQKQGF